MIAVLLFVVASVTMLVGITGPVLKQQKVVRDLNSSRQSYFLTESGIEDVIYRLKTNKTVGLSETLSLNGSTVTTLTTDVSGGKEVVSTGDFLDRIRKVKVNLTIGEGVSFHYGVHVGQGGFTLNNNAGVNGNVYSNSSVTGANGAFVTGSIVAVSNIDKIVIGTGTTGDGYAPTVTNSTIRGNLYCQSGSGNNKSCNTSMSNPTAQDFPITDEQITSWQDETALGGTFVGNKTFSGANGTLGPLKIQGNLTVSNNSTLTLTGSLWVTGNVSLSNNSTIKLVSGYGSSGGFIIADGTSSISNNASFSGSGTSGSYIMLLSTNSSGGAISLSNNAGSAILYAPNGTVQLSNGAHVKQITAKTIALSNNATIDYEQGLADSTFTTGPGGGYQILNWQEI